jgi:hypothetical protein
VTQSNKQIVLLTNPLQRIADATEATTIVLNKIAEVVLNGASSKSGDTTSDELKKQTTILSDIRSILREQNKVLANGAGAKGGASGGMFSPMSAKDVGLTALMIVGVAGAIVGAAAIFTLVPVISIGQLLTVLAVAGIFALIAPTFVKIAEVLSGQKDLAGNAKGGDMSSPKAMFALAGATALAMVGIAISIVLSGAIFTLMPVITGGQFLTVLAIAVIMIPAAYAYSMILKATKDLKKEQLIFAAAAIPLMAIGIVAAAYAFMLLPSGANLVAPDPIWVLKSALAIGLFATGFYFIMKAIKGATTKELLYGALAIPLIALSIVAISVIFMLLPQGDNLMAPDPIWVLKSALAIGLFATGFYFIMKAIKGATTKELIFGAVAIPIMAIGIVATAFIFMAMPGNPVAPDPIWVLKSALAIGLFATGFYFIMKAIKGATTKELIFGAVAIPIMAIGIVATAFIFMAMPSNPSAPDPIWVLKSALAIGLFATGFYFIMKAIKGATTKELLFGALAIPIIAASIVLTSYIFMAMPSNPLAPDPIWVLKSALAIGLFAVGFYFIMKAIKGASLKELIFGALSIPIIATSIVLTSYIFMAMPSNPLSPDPIWVLKSALAIGLFAVGFYFIMKAIKGASLKELIFGALSIPIIATGIVLTSYIFMALPATQVAPDPVWVLKSALAIGLFAIGSYFVMKAIKGATTKELLFMALAIPIIATGIVLTAYIFMAMPSNPLAPDPIWVLKSALAIGLFAIGSYFVMKAIKGATTKELLFMALAIPIIAFGILATAWIFQGLPDVYKAPEPTWTLKSALAIVLFGAMIYLSSKTIGKLSMGDMLKALLGVVVTSFAILAVAWLFQMLPGSFVAPPLDWTLAVGVALGAFALVITAVGLAVSALTPATLLLGALGIIVIAITIVAVGWILSLLEPAMPSLKAVSNGFVDIVMAPVHGIIDAFARFKNEIGVENLIPLAVGVAALGGAWLIFSAAVAGGSVAGLLGSAAGAVGAIFNGISSLFGGDTPSPLDILKELAVLGPQIQTLAAPLTAVGVGFAMINKSANGVSKAFESVTKFVGDTDVDDLTANAKSLSSIANSYIKISNASKTLNVKAIESTTNMFKALTDLAKNNGQSAMGILADKLLVAVKELTGAAKNLEDSVSKQGANTAAAGDAIGASLTKVKETVTNVKKDVSKMTADAKGVMDIQPLIDAITKLEDRFDTFITVKIKQ